MKLFFDANLSKNLPSELSNLYPDSTQAEFEKLDEESDRVIWNFCKQNDFTIVTKDKDYFDLSSMLGSPPKIILIKSGNCSTKKIVELLTIHNEQIQVFLNAEKIHCLFLH